MNWCSLFTDFAHGNADAIQAIFSIIGCLIAGVGTALVVATFNQQKKINRDQLELNRLSLEKDRRDLMPILKGHLTDETNENGFVMYTIIATGNTARNLEVFPLNSNGKPLPPKWFPLDVIIPGDKGISLEINIPSIQPRSEFIKQYLIYYTDEVGRPYT